MNLDPMVAQVIQSGKASLRELRECYSMHDLFDMWEVVHTAKYNQWIADEAVRKERELRRK